MVGACAYSAAPLATRANPIPAVKIKENKDFDEWRYICHLRFPPIWMRAMGIRLTSKNARFGTGDATGPPFHYPTLIIPRLPGTGTLARFCPDAPLDRGSSRIVGPDRAPGPRRHRSRRQ